MSVETPSIFAKVIQDHLELKERNSRLEETMDGEEPAVNLDATVPAWPGEETVDNVNGSSDEESLWGKSRDFDWGD